MEKFYHWTALGLILTTATGWLTAFHLYEPLFEELRGLKGPISGISFFLIWAALLVAGLTLSLILWWRGRAWRLSARKARLFLTLYGILTGLIFSITMFPNTPAAIIQVYLPPVGMFVFMSLYAQCTGHDRILVMGLFGLALALLLKLYLGISWVGFAVSAAAVLLFMGLAAWSRWKVRQHMEEGMTSSRAALGGALEFYLALSLCLVFWLILFIPSRREE